MIGTIVPQFGLRINDKSTTAPSSVFSSVSWRHYG